MHYFVVFEDLEVLNFMLFRPESKIKTHILIKMTPDTVINISKKISFTVSVLVEMVKERLAELKAELDAKIKELKTPKF